MTSLLLPLVGLRVNVFDHVHVQSVFARTEWFCFSTEQQFGDATDHPEFKFETAPMMRTNHFSDVPNCSCWKRTYDPTDFWLLHATSHSIQFNASFSPKFKSMRRSVVQFVHYLKRSVLAAIRFLFAYSLFQYR